MHCEVSMPVRIYHSLQLKHRQELMRTAIIALGCYCEGEDWVTFHLRDKEDR